MLKKRKKPFSPFPTHPSPMKPSFFNCFFVFMLFTVTIWPHIIRYTSIICTPTERIVHIDPYKLAPWMEAVLRFYIGPIIAFVLAVCACIYT